MLIIFVLVVFSHYFYLFSLYLIYNHSGIEVCQSVRGVFDKLCTLHRAVEGHAAVW